MTESTGRRLRERRRRWIARGRMRRLGPEESLRTWRAMVSGRWTLVDQFDSDGKRFLVARA